MFEYSVILRWRYERAQLAPTQIQLKKEVQSLVQRKPAQITKGPVKDNQEYMRANPTSTLYLKL